VAKLLERAAAGVAAVWLGDVFEPCPNKRRLPSGNLLHSYAKWPIYSEYIVNLPIKNGDFA